MSIKDLKNKNKELKEIKKLEDSVKTSTIALPLSKEEVRFIKRQNKKPFGTKSVQNTEGNIIDVVGITKSYVIGDQKFNALKNVSFSIKKGEFIVILGPSGSGKSTLLNVLSGLDRITEGQIIVDNANIAALTNKELTTFRRNNVGFIFQSYNLLPELNARDNAEIGRVLQIDGNKRGNIEEIFEGINMSGRINSPVNALSGGQAQRVSIARALAKRPQIIFADEPTGALDSETSKQVLDLFKKLNKESKTTIIFVTHDKEISKIADRVLVVKDGVAKFE